MHAYFLKIFSSEKVHSSHNSFFQTLKPDWSTVNDEICDLCEKSFNMIKSIKNHEKIRTYNGEQCEKKFNHHSIGTC